MFNPSKSGINAYSKIGLETGVLAASPHRLIGMLYEGALAAISQASVHMANNDIIKKGEAIAKAVSIILSGLRGSLNHKEGGELASNLDALYDYMCRRLFEANIKNSQEMLGEVQKLLTDIKSAWDEIGDTVDKKPDVNEAEAAALAANIDPLAPRKVLTEMRA